MVISNHIGMVLQYAVDDSSLDTNTFTVNDAQDYNVLLKANPDILLNDLLSIFGSKHMQVKSAVYGVFNGLFIIVYHSHTPSNISPSTKPV